MNRDFAVIERRKKLKRNIRTVLFVNCPNLYRHHKKGTMVV